MTPLDIPAEIVLFGLFVLGTVVGSFLNVCIHRFPAHDNLRDQLRGIVSPPSRCPGCFRRILGRDNIPVLGWLMLGGRCRNCRRRISFRYPAIELFNGFLFAFVYYLEVPVDFLLLGDPADWGTSFKQSVLFAPLGPRPESHSLLFGDVALLNLRYLYHMVLIEALLVATFIDIDLKIIPDASTVPAMIVGVIAAFAYGRLWLVPVWFQDPSILATLRDFSPDWLAPLLTGGRVPGWTTEHPHLHGLAVSLVGLAVGGGVVWAIRLLGYWVLRREAMGFGDVVLMAMVGSFIGWQPTLVAFFMGTLIAVAFVAACFAFRRYTEIPYGPYLAAGTVTTLLGWRWVWPQVERIFDLGPVVPLLMLIGGFFMTAALMLIQLAKRAMGIPLYPSEWIEEWTSADQLSYQAGENADVHQGRWRSAGWQGIAAARGTAHEEQWRNAPASSTWGPGRGGLRR